MRARALTVLTIFGLGCIPSEDLASYSDGLSGMSNPDNPGIGGGSGDAVVPETLPESGAAGGGAGAGESAPPVMFAGGVAGAGGAPNSGGMGVGVPVEEPPAEEEPPSEPAPPSQFRFVRFMADSDVTLGPLTSVAEFNVLGDLGEPIDRSMWIAEADSEELVFPGGVALASLAIDGASASMWHTAWFEVVPPPHPHFLQIDMGQAHEISGFRYLARQDAALDGRVADYRFFVSVDGVDWGQPVSTGTLLNVDTEQEILFTP